MRTIVAALLLLCLCATQAQAAGGRFSSWERVHEVAPFPARASALSAYFPPSSSLGPHGRWLIQGGLTLGDDPKAPNVRTTLADVWTSDDLGVTWQEQASSPLRRCEMAADVVSVVPANGTMPDGTGTVNRTHVLVATGGIDFTNFTSFGDVHVSEDNGASFKLVNKRAPWPVRHGHALVTVNRTADTPAVVLLSGYLIQGEHVRSWYNDVWISRNLGVDWTALPTAPWAPRGDAGVHATPAGVVFVAGGYGKVGLDEGMLNDVWMSSVDLKSWTEMTAAAAWAPRWGHALKHFHHDNSLVVLGGDHDSSTEGHIAKSNEVWLSHDDGKTWTLSGEGAFGGRSDFMLEHLADGHLYIAGGEDDTKSPAPHVNSDVWKSLHVPGEENHGGKKLSTGAIVVIIVAVVAVIALAAFFILRKKKANNHEPAGGYHLQGQAGKPCKYFFL